MTQMKNLLGLAVIAMGLSAPAFAGPTFVMGNNSVTSIGAQFPSPYDELYVTGTTGNASGVQDIATIKFVVGTNCYSCTSTPSASLPDYLTVGGVTETINLPWTWSSTGSTDTLAFGPIAPLTFDLAGGEIVTATFSTPSALSGGTGSYTEPLHANFAVPEPSALAVIGLGLFGMGMIKRKRAV